MIEIVGTAKFLIINYLHEIVCKNPDIALKEALGSLNFNCQKCLRFNSFFNLPSIWYGPKKASNSANTIIDQLTVI